MAKTIYNGKLVETIDCTPTWEQILPALLHVIENGNAEGVKTAKEEIKRMAQIADKYVAANKIADGAKTINLLGHTIVLTCNDPESEWEISEEDEEHILYTLGQDYMKEINYKGRFDLKRTGYKLEWHILGRG